MSASAKNPDSPVAKRLALAVYHAWKASDSMQGRVDSLHAAVYADPELLWEMLGRYFDPAARTLLSIEDAKHRRGRKPATPRMTWVNPHPRKLPVVTNAIISKWERFKINDTPIMETDVVMAYNWALANQRDTRFVQLAIAGLPLVNQPIGKFRTVEELNAFGEQAEAERRAA